MDNAENLQASAQHVQKALDALGLNLKVQELPQSTRSAAQAAEAIGCQIAQIAKSLLFKTKISEQPILVIASGVNRVDEKKLAGLIGEPLELAPADFVRQQTGFAIGGVPPVGHLHPLETWIDQDLLGFDEIWAAAGTPNAVFRLKPADLLTLAGRRVVDLSGG